MSRIGNPYNKYTIMSLLFLILPRQDIQTICHPMRVYVLKVELSHKFYILAAAVVKLSDFTKSTISGHVKATWRKLFCLHVQHKQERGALL